MIHSIHGSISLGNNTRIYDSCALSLLKSIHIISNDKYTSAYTTCTHTLLPILLTPMVNCSLSWQRAGSQYYFSGRAHAHAVQVWAVNEISFTFGRFSHRMLKHCSLRMPTLKLRHAQLCICRPSCLDLKYLLITLLWMVI